MAPLPHVHQQPMALVAEGRKDPEKHDEANIIIEPFDIDKQYTQPRLPVAGLPPLRGEIRLIYLTKIRPAIIVGNPGAEIRSGLRTGMARSQTTRTYLVAPYYGADQSGGRSGWNPEFLKRIRRAEYPQYMWDSLPGQSKVKDSVLRFDHIQPVGSDPKGLTLTKFKLSDEALEILEEWMQWLRLGRLDPQGTISFLRGEFSKIQS